MLTQWIAHLQRLADALRGMGYDPVVLRGGLNAKNRSAALARMQPQPGRPSLLAVATGPYAGEGFDCPVLETLFLAAQSDEKDGSSSTPGASCAPTAEIHDYHDTVTGVLAMAGGQPSS